MKLDDLRRLANTNIRPGNYVEKIDRYSLILRNEWGDAKVLEELKFIAVIMSERLGWHPGTNLLVREGWSESRFDCATINCKNGIWMCDVDDKDDYVLIHIPHYNKVEKILGVRVNIKTIAFKPSLVSNVVSEIAKTLKEKCFWPSTTIVGIDRDVLNASTNVIVEDGRGNTYTVVGLDREIYKNKIVSFDFPHYDILQCLR